MSELYYKALRAGRIGPYSNYQWPPPGEWVEVKGDLVPCRNGIHYCTEAQIIHWLHDEIWTIEVSGDFTDIGNKRVCGKASLIKQLDLWTPQSARLFAADCAADVQHLARGHRGAEAIRVARLFAIGEASQEQAAADAYYAADADADAYYAADAAAGADAAAYYGGYAAARRWQTARLMKVLHDPEWTKQSVAFARSLV